LKGVIAWSALGASRYYMWLQISVTIPGCFYKWHAFVLPTIRKKLLFLFYPDVERNPYIIEKGATVKARRNTYGTYQSLLWGTSWEL
jgi:hypothetical protein